MRDRRAERARGGKLGGVERGELDAWGGGCVSVEDEVEGLFCSPAGGKEREGEGEGVT